MTDDGGEAEAASGAGEDGGADEAAEPSAAERFRRRIAELEDRLEASDDDAEREALESDLEHLRAGLRAVERSDGGA